MINFVTLKPFVLQKKQFLTVQEREPRRSGEQTSKSKAIRGHQPQFSIAITVTLSKSNQYLYKDAAH